MNAEEIRKLNSIDTLTSEQKAARAIIELAAHMAEHTEINRGILKCQQQMEAAAQSTMDTNAKMLELREQEAAAYLEAKKKESEFWSLKLKRFPTTE